jgi:hypothetical protein
MNLSKMVNFLGINLLFTEEFMLPRPDQKTINTIKHAMNLLSGVCCPGVDGPPCSSDPGRIAAPDHCEACNVAPRKTTGEAPTFTLFRGSIARHSNSLFTLHRDGYPATMQNSLPAAGQALPGRLDLQGSQRKVLYMLTWT